MSPPLLKGKGFKNDKRNLIESTNNLVVLGQATSQKPQNASRFRGRRSRSRSKSRTRPLVPGPALPVISAFGQRTRTFTVNGRGTSGTTPWITNSVLHNQQQPFSLTASVTTPTPGELKYLLPFQNSEHEKKSGAVTCAVCGRGFEPPKFNSDPVSEIMKNSLRSYQKSGLMTKRNLEDGWGSITGKPKINVAPQDVVCVGTCGELFHKLCLRDYCSHHHNKSSRGPNCPRCGLEVKFLNCQEIDILPCFSNSLTAFERQVYKTTVMNKELQVLWPEANNHLTKLKQEISDAETIYQQFRSQRRKVKSELKKLTADDLGIVMAKITDVTTLKATLDKQEKALEFMQQETLQIMRMYLITVLRKLKSYAPSGDYSSLPNIPERIPRDLIPVLGSMLNDDQTLGLLSRIVAPRQDEMSDATKLKMLEDKILEKYGKNALIELARKSTYTVFSSSDMPEIDDTEPEEANGMKINSSTFASGENTTAYHKSSNATDSVPDITPLIKAALPQSDSVETREKPPKLLDIMEIMKSEMIMKGQPTMPSKNRTPVPPSTGSSGNGGMPKQSSMEVVAGSDVGFGISRSGTCEVSYKYEEGGDPSTAVSIKASTPIAADTKLHTVSQNSFPITELLTVKEGSNEKESLVNSLDSSAISQQRQNIQIPSINPSSNESKSTGVEKPPQVHQIMELSTPEALSGRSWSTVSDDGEEEGRDVEEAMPPLEEIIEEFKETDTGESTNVDNDCKSGFCMVKTPVVRSPPLEIVGKFEWKETTESETGCDDCGKDKPLVELNSNGRVVARTVPISYQSESSVPRLSNTGQVSIAIMYIIETSEEEQEDRNEETEEESGSSTDQDEQDNEPVSDQQTQSILPPVYLTADKTSNYSIIAGQKSDLSNSNSKENVPLRKPHNEGEVAANLGFGSSIIGSGSSSIAAPGMDPQRSKNGNGKCNSESFGSAYNRSGRKADVTVSYENEKVIKKPQNIERKLLSK